MNCYGDMGFGSASGDALRERSNLERDLGHDFRSMEGEDTIPPQLNACICCDLGS